MNQGYGGSSSDYITDDVQKFLGQFLLAIESGLLHLISPSYSQFKRVTLETFKVSSWPSIGSVLKSLRLDPSKHEMFCLLYSELYYRHIFDRCETDMSHMWDAFQNYINLFNKLIEARGSVPVIPDSWLWEMVNSFVSQFQYYQHWKNDSGNSDYLLQFQGSKQQQEAIQEKWTVQAVLRYLHALVMAGRIELQYNPSVLMGGAGDDSGRLKAVPNTLRMLGFYSLIGLLRMHCLVNDYRTALKVLNLVDLRKKSGISKISHCHVTAHYYLALCYLMTKRWVDCQNVCVSVLLRYQGSLPDNLFNIDVKVARHQHQDEDLTDKDIYHEKYLGQVSMLLRCCALLAMAYVLNNKTQRLDNILLDLINDMFSDDLPEINDDSMRNYQRSRKQSRKSKKKDESSSSHESDSKSKKNESGNESEKEKEQESESESESKIDSNLQRKHESFRNLFLLGCPDYPNTFDLFVDTEAAQIASLDLKLSQFEKFFRLVNLDKSYEISRMRDELKLYQAIPAKKLAKELDFGDSNTFEKELIQLKSQMRQLKRVDGVSSNGQWSTQSDFDFFMKKENVNVRRVDGSRLGRYTDTFVTSIKQMKDLIAANNVH